jgi:alpha-mannosidase
MNTKKLIAGLLALLPAINALEADPAKPSPESEAEPVFYVIPHTHWEGAVFITREEYLEMGLSHILTALRLLKEHPNYRFTLDQAEYFRAFLERYPEEADAFRKFVAEGRLQIVGGLDIMPDDNMPGGESFVRQMLYAKGYCREALGVEVKVGWLIDTFGHHAQLPQILRLAGYDSFWFTRGIKDPAHMPSEFLWQGIDGTQIHAFWIPHGYANLAAPPRDLAGFAALMTREYNSLAVNSRNAPYRAGFNGSDVSDPELYVPELVDEFNRQTNKPFTLRLAVPTEYEAAAARRQDLPVITGERNPLFQGVYSTRIELKQRMRETERLLTTAEKFGALSQWLGAPVDNQIIWRAWEPALFNVTHDLGSGVMTDHVYEDVNRGYDFAGKLGSDLLETRVRDVLARTETSGQGVPVAVFNTLGWTRTDVAQGDVGFAEGGLKGFAVFDPAGKEIPAQLVASDPYEDGGLRRVKFVFVARDVPAMGCAVYHVAGLKSPGKFTGIVNETGHTLENDFYKAEVDLKTGAITSLRLKAGDWESLAKPANVVATEDDHGDVWELFKTLNGGQIDIMTRPIGVPDAAKARFSDKETGDAGTIRRGPVFSEFQVRHPFGTNTFATTIRLYQGVPRVDFETKILNREKFVRYRLLAPTSIQNGRDFQEIPFGAIERPMSQEFPAQNWADYSDDTHGVTLLNRGLPGNNVAGGTLILSLMRSTAIQSYGNFDQAAIASGTALELGKERTFHYALVPHTGDWRQANAYRAGLEFNNPLIVRKAAAHTGSLPGVWGLLDVSPANVVLSAFKPANDGSSIIRVYEADGRATAATLKLHAKVLSANEANLMEDTGKKLKAQDDSIHFDLHPFEIKTFKLRLKGQ